VKHSRKNTSPSAVLPAGERSLAGRCPAPPRLTTAKRERRRRPLPALFAPRERPRTEMADRNIVSVGGEVKKFQSSSWGAAKRRREEWGPQLMVRDADCARSSPWGLSFRGTRKSGLPDFRTKYAQVRINPTCEGVNPESRATNSGFTISPWIPDRR